MKRLLCVFCLLAACLALVCCTEDRTGGGEPLPAPAPENLTAQEGDGQVALRWTEPVSDGLLEYDVRWNPGGGQRTMHVGFNYLVVDGLANGTEYAFSVTAVYADGRRSDSVSVKAVPHVGPWPEEAVTGPISTTGSFSSASIWVSRRSRFPFFRSEYEAQSAQSCRRGPVYPTVLLRGGRRQRLERPKLGMESDSGRGMSRRESPGYFSGDHREQYSRRLDARSLGDRRGRDGLRDGRAHHARRPDRPHSLYVPQHRARGDRSSGYQSGDAGRFRRLCPEESGRRRRFLALDRRSAAQWTCRAGRTRSGRGTNIGPLMSTTATGA